MGADLFSACVFCAGMLLNIDLVPPKGFSGELAAGYATMQRQVESGSPAVDDRADTTLKYGAVGFRWARPAAADLGAGTPASEFRIRFAFPNSHDEGAQAKRSPLQLISTGTGRYENLAGLGRYAIGSADSVEVAMEQRRHKIVDLLNTDGRQDFFAYTRNQVAEDIELGLGWRHRWRNFELAGAVQTTRLEGRSETPLAKIVASGNIPGGRLELRTRQGSWTFFLLARAVSGHIDVEESYVTNGRRTVSRTAWIQGLTLSAQKHAGKFDVALSGTYDKSRLPFVAMAITGSEQYAVDGGYHAESRTKQWLAEIIIRHEVVPGVFPRFYFRFTHGSESVGLSDSNGVLPLISLQLIRGGQFPPVGSNPTAPEFGMGFGLEFGFKSVGGSN